MAEIRVGIAGWTYAPWRGNFYPSGLTQKLELAYASRRFNALEVNGTFYSLQRPTTFQKWYDATPADFMFSLKGDNRITHVRRLKEPHEPLANFLASGILGLRDKLGPILWQFPPTMTFDEDRFKQFFEILPHDTVELARFAKQHNTRTPNQVCLEVDAKRPVRHAVEFRHKSFLTDRFTDLLLKHNVALVIADAASKYPSAEDVTADWVYVRLHGSRKLQASGYAPREIKAWGTKLKAWHEGGEPSEARRIGGKAQSVKHGRDVYVFFDNTDVKVRAPVDARSMVKELGLGPGESVSQVLKDLGV